MCQSTREYVDTFDIEREKRGVPVHEWRFHAGYQPRKVRDWEEYIQATIEWAHSHDAPMVLGSFLGAFEPSVPQDQQNDRLLSELRQAVTFICNNPGIIAANYWQFCDPEDTGHPGQLAQIDGSGKCTLTEFGRIYAEPSAIEQEWEFFLGRIVYHTEQILANHGQVELWKRIRDAAISDSGSASGLMYLEQFLDDALIQLAKSPATVQLWEEIDQLARRDTAEHVS